MVKLIRLESDDNTGYFDKHFNEDIILKKNSKIALHSISVETVYDDIIINSSNNVIKYKIASNTERSIVLNNNTYNLTNIHQLYNDIQNKLNDSLVSDNGNNLGITWFCNDTNGKINIGYSSNLFINFDKPGQPTTISGQPEQNFVNVTRANLSQNGTQTFKSDVADTTDNNNYFFQSHPWCKGSAFFRSRVKTFVANASGNLDNGFRLCLLDINPNSLDGASISEDNIVASLRFNRHNETYRIKLGSGNAETNTAVNAKAITDDVTNDMLEMICVGTRLRIRVYKDGVGAINELGNMSIPKETNGSRSDLFPVVIYYGSGTNCVTDNYRCSTTLPIFPHRKANDVFLHDELLGATANYPNFVIARNQIKNITFTMPAPSLYEPLGFIEGVITQKASDLFLESDFTFQLTNQSDCILVETENIELQSYDSLHKGRRNILNCIALNDNQISINNEMKNLVYIDVKNTEDRLLRNIRIQLRRHDLTKLNVRGKSSVVILLDN